MPDFCVIGSGAAGGVCALKLAEAGFDVIVLEEGPNIPKEQGHGGPSHERKMLNEREVEMYKLLYQEGGTRLTKNGGVKVLQGRCLGGGTAVNWSACLPPRLETLDEWQKRGLPFTRQNLDPYLREVVNYLPIVRNDKYNTSAHKFIEGCDHLGIPHDNLPNNTHNCRECGSCGVGCPYDRKMSGFVKWLPDAIAKGATVYTDTKVDKLVGTGDRITEVHCHFIDGKNRPTKGTLVVKPTKGVVLAAGAIGTPAILLRSKLNAGKRVGKCTHIHPVTITIGKYPEKTHPAYGVPDNMWTPKFAPGPTGYLIETGSFFPVFSASATLQHGDELHRILRDYYPTAPSPTRTGPSGSRDEGEAQQPAFAAGGDPLRDVEERLVHEGPVANDPIRPPCSATRSRPLPSPAWVTASGSLRPPTTDSSVRPTRGGSNEPPGATDTAGLGESFGWPEGAIDGAAEREPGLLVGPGPAQPTTMAARTSRHSGRRTRRVIWSSYVRPSESVPGC